MNNVIEKLRECHDHILEHLGRLEQVVRRIGISCFPSGEFQDAQEQLKAFFHFMETSAALHTFHEEHGLFPVLSSHFHGHQECTPVDMMESEHRKAEGVWLLQKERFERLKEQDETAPKDFLEFCATMMDLIALYRHHIWKENNVLFPMAERLLTQQEFNTVWTRMHSLHEGRSTVAAGAGSPVKEC